MHHAHTLAFNTHTHLDKILVSMFIAGQGSFTYQFCIKQLCDQNVGLHLHISICIQLQTHNTYLINTDTLTNLAILSADVSQAQIHRKSQTHATSTSQVNQRDTDMNTVQLCASVSDLAPQ